MISRRGAVYHLFRHFFIKMVTVRADGCGRISFFQNHVDVLTVREKAEVTAEGIAVAKAGKRWYTIDAFEDLKNFLGFRAFFIE